MTGYGTVYNELRALNWVHDVHSSGHQVYIENNSHKRVSECVLSVVAVSDTEKVQSRATPKRLQSWPKPSHNYH